MVRKIDYERLSRDEIISEVIKKKEFSDLPRKDVEMVYSRFEDEEFVEDRIKKTRELLMKMYTAFVSDKLLNVKDKDPEWFLNRHKSTKERLGFYEEVYERCLEGIGKNQDEIFDNNNSHLARSPAQYLSKISKDVKGKQGGEGRKVSKENRRGQIQVVDFGCGVNGFSYEFFEKVGYNVSYLGIEPVGQLVDLQNLWFEKMKFEGRCVKASLFNLKEVKKIVEQIKGRRVGFFFKVLDSLEMLKRDYSKEVLKELVPLFDRCVVSWATKSLGDRKKIFATKKWLREFVDSEFNILNEFEVGGENYLIFVNSEKTL